MEDVEQEFDERLQLAEDRGTNAGNHDGLGEPLQRLWCLRRIGIEVRTAVRGSDLRRVAAGRVRIRLRLADLLAGLRVVVHDALGLKIYVTLGRRAATRITRGDVVERLLLPRFELRAGVVVDELRSGGRVRHFPVAAAVHDFCRDVRRLFRGLGEIGRGGRRVPATPGASFTAGRRAAGLRA